MPPHPEMQAGLPYRLPPAVEAGGNQQATRVEGKMPACRGSIHPEGQKALLITAGRQARPAREDERRGSRPILPHGPPQGWTPVADPACGFLSRSDQQKKRPISLFESL